MSLFNRLFGSRRTAAPASRPHSQIASAQHSVNPNNSPGATRRELLRVVLRDSMNRHGIPASWIGAEMLVATSRNRESGIHWRLVIKHWEPRLMTHAIAFQHSLIRRIMTFDPMASSWLMGISWQFALPDESVCPEMPPPVTWTLEPHEPFVAPQIPVVAGGSADVIAGPVRIAEPEAEAADPVLAARADLEALMALREDDFKRHAGDEMDGATRPVFLATEPAKL